MNQLTDQGALQIIKAVLDASTKAGLFSKLEESMAIIEAYNHICNKLEPVKKEIKQDA